MRLSSFCFLAFVLCSCSTVVTTKPTQLPMANTPAIEPLHLMPFSWKIYNEDDLKKLLTTLPPGGHITLYSLDGDNYLAYDNDLTEIQRYIEEQNQVIEFYRKLENVK